MKSLLVICPHPENTAPSQRLKYEQYFEHWRSNGFEVVVSPFMTRRFRSIVYQPGRILEKVFWVGWGYLRRIRDLLRLPFYDGAYVHLWVTPLGLPLFEWLYAMVARSFVYDIDDMVFLGHSSEANRFIQVLKGRKKMTLLMRRADHVIVCTPHLEAFVQRYNSETTDISSTIDTDRYVPVNPYSRDRRLTLGWSGSHSTAKYLHLLDDVLKEIGREIEFRLKVIGDPSFRMDGVEVDAQEWREPTEVQDLQEIDIGLYPLPDEEWVLGKSGLKALQYMALGIPTVATRIGANGRIIQDEENGFLVSDQNEWKDRLLELASDPDLRRRIGDHATRTVSDRFSVHANRDVYLGVLDAVFNEPESSRDRARKEALMDRASTDRAPDR
jgi:glycosyltransferase involved in cell wall biosynthesis